MELIARLTDENVIAFLLLFVRITAVMAFFPFFDNQRFFVTAKAALAFYLTLVLFPVLPLVDYSQMTVEMFAIAVLSEAMMGFIASIFLQMVFHMVSFAGELIAFAMGFSIASAVDPITNQQSPLIGQILTLTALMLMLAADMHHMILLYMHQTMLTVPLGGFVLSDNMIEYVLNATQNLFLMGFTMAFPIIALIMLSDIIFGMIMKTNPQFNILVVGFPVKIAIAFVVLIAILPAFYLVFKNEFKEAFNALQMFVR